MHDFLEFSADPEAEKWLKDEFAEWDAELPQSIRAALAAYKNSGYQNLNDRARAGMAGEEHTLLDQAIASHTLQQAVVTYRGVIDGAERLHGLTTGAEVKDDGYWSTSLLEDVAWGFASTGSRPETRVVLRIFLDAAAEAIETVAPDLTEQMHEYELLLPRGSSFTVIAEPELRTATKANNAPYYLIDLEPTP